MALQIVKYKSIQQITKQICDEKFDHMFYVIACMYNKVFLKLKFLFLSTFDMKIPWSWIYQLY